MNNSMTSALTRSDNDNGDGDAIGDDNFFRNTLNSKTIHHYYMPVTEALLGSQFTTYPLSITKGFPATSPLVMFSSYRHPLQTTLEGHEPVTGGS